MKTFIMTLASIALLLCSLSVNVHAQETSDHDAIIAAAYDYAFGVANHDIERIERAYAMDQAQLKLVVEQDGEPTVFIMPIRDLMEKIWLQIPESPNHTVEVLDLNIVEGKYATIVINNNNQFLDQLSLYKIEGQWKIVDKLAIRHPDAPPSTADFVEIFGNQSGMTIGLTPKN